MMIMVHWLICSCIDDDDHVDHDVYGNHDDRSNHGDFGDYDQHGEQLDIAQYRYLRGVQNTEKKDNKITITSWYEDWLQKASILTVRPRDDLRGVMPLWPPEGAIGGCQVSK